MLIVCGAFKLYLCTQFVMLIQFFFFKIQEEITLIHVLICLSLSISRLHQHHLKPCFFIQHDGNYKIHTVQRKYNQIDKVVKCIYMQKVPYYCIKGLCYHHYTILKKRRGKKSFFAMM